MLPSTNSIEVKKVEVIVVDHSLIIRKNEFHRLFSTLLILIAIVPMAAIVFIQLIEQQIYDFEAWLLFTAFFIVSIGVIFLILHLSYYRDKNYKIKRSGNLVEINRQKALISETSKIIIKRSPVRYGGYKYNIVLVLEGIRIVIAYYLDGSNASVVVQELSDYLGIEILVEDVAFLE